MVRNRHVAVGKAGRRPRRPSGRSSVSSGEDLPLAAGHVDQESGAVLRVDIRVLALPDQWPQKHAVLVVEQDVHPGLRAITVTDAAGGSPATVAAAGEASAAPAESARAAKARARDFVIVVFLLIEPGPLPDLDDGDLSRRRFLPCMRARPGCTERHGMIRHLSMRQKACPGWPDTLRFGGRGEHRLGKPQMRAPISLRDWLARPRSISIGSLVTRLKPRPFCAQT